MAESTYNREPKEIIKTVVEDVEPSETIRILHPGQRLIKGAIEALSSFEDDSPSIKLLANETDIKDTVEDFKVASKAAQIIEKGNLSIKSNEVQKRSTLIITETTTASVVEANGKTNILQSDNTNFVEDATAEYQNQWDEENEFTLRTPPINKIIETLEEEISKEARETFESILDATNEVTGNEGSLSSVNICLLSAARNDILLYNISKWGEDVGIASKATFSRSKTNLENSDIIETEKVPIDIGRPRLKLKLADNLEELDTEELVERVIE